MNHVARVVVTVTVAAMTAIIVLTVFGEQEGETTLPNLDKARELLLTGDRLAREGKPDEAWASFCESRKQFNRAAFELSISYIEVVFDGLLRERQVGDAVTMAREFLIKSHGNPKVTDRQKAKAQLLIGHAYFRDGRFDIARDEYNTVIVGWPQTPEKTEAQFRICLTLMAQGLSEKCEEFLHKLSQSEQKEVAARAHGLLSVLHARTGYGKRAEEERSKAISMGCTKAEIEAWRMEMMELDRRHRRELEALRVIGAP